MRTVLFSQRVEIIEDYHERRDCADQRIADFIYHCGYLPVPVPNCADYINNYISTLHPCGIILTGGNSLVTFGGNSPEKDATDQELIRLAIKNEIPIYGFCRGMQSLLDYFGCPLTNVPGHVAVQHKITGSIGDRTVNSYHSQGCLMLNPDSGFKVTALANDGVVEAIEHINLPIIATMWHPERISPYGLKDMNHVKNLFH